MNPLTISKSDNTELRMNNDTQRPEIVTVKAENQREAATPQCHNGICMVAWKPTKPQAA